MHNTEIFSALLYWMIISSKWWGEWNQIVLDHFFIDLPVSTYISHIFTHPPRCIQLGVCYDGSQVNNTPSHNNDDNDSHPDTNHTILWLLHCHLNLHHYIIEICVNCIGIWDIQWIRIAIELKGLIFLNYIDQKPPTGRKQIFWDI